MVYRCPTYQVTLLLSLTFILISHTSYSQTIPSTTSPQPLCLNVIVSKSNKIKNNFSKKNSLKDIHELESIILYCGGNKIDSRWNSKTGLRSFFESRRTDSDDVTTG